jgi:hypothetical protein
MMRDTLNFLKGYARLRNSDRTLKIIDETSLPTDFYYRAFLNPAWSIFEFIACYSYVIQSKKMNVMRMNLTTVAIITLLAGYSSESWGQEKRRDPFWVVEGNSNQQTYSILRFYNGNGELVKEERLQGRFLDIRKKRDRIFMERKLAAVMRYKNDWAENGRLRK